MLSRSQMVALIVADYELETQLAHQVAHNVTRIEVELSDNGFEVSPEVIDSIKQDMRAMFGAAKDDMEQTTVNSLFDSPIPTEMLADYVSHLQSPGYKLVKQIMIASFCDMSKVIAEHFAKFRAKTVERLRSEGIGE